jgi:cation diffusion facilitator CzcD-associated flavoprotein CzcO
VTNGASSSSLPSAGETHDAIVVGAGFAGLYMLYRLRGLGLSTRVIEAGDGVGGTWYWNRYPGARCDVPSLEYSYSFSKELQEEWEWTELMPSQPEVERYLNHVADRFDLRRDIELSTRVTAAVFDERRARWLIETNTGRRFSARFCVMATGCLSAPYRPEYPGADSFRGLVLQTSLWPKEDVDLSGRRVGMIGTGSSAVQATPEIAAVAEHLYVFQRTPTFTFPSMNRPLEPEFQRKVKDNYDEVRRVQRQSQVGISGYNAAGAFIQPPNKKILETPFEERMAMLDERGWGAIRMFSDVQSSLEANAAAVEMYCEMVRRTVKDPEVAEALSPRSYPLGCKRIVVDKDYFVTFNRPNVTLVDIRRAPIEAITPAGLRTAEREYEFDVLVYATGFDAMTGALNRIDIRGREGMALREKWQYGPRSYLGIQVAGFPNLFTITGPGSPSVLSNMVVSIEQHVDWVADALEYMAERGLDTIEPTVEAEDAWVDHVNQVAQGTMYTAESCNSWYLGANIAGKPRVFMPYVGGVGRYADRCREVVANGYKGFVLARAGGEAAVR